MNLSRVDFRSPIKVQRLPGFRQPQGVASMSVGAQADGRPNVVGRITWERLTLVGSLIQASYRLHVAEGKHAPGIYTMYVPVERADVIMVADPEDARPARGRKEPLPE
jgi:hypothetical protein